MARGNRIPAAAAMFTIAFCASAAIAQESRGNNASFMRMSNIDSSPVMKPRDIQIGAHVTF